MQHRRHFLHTLGSAAALGGLSPLSALAQALDQVKIMYGFPAGSAGDSVARRVAEKLGGTPYSKNAGFVENKPGAGGRIAVETLKNSPADGSVLTLAPVSALAVYPLHLSQAQPTSPRTSPGVHRRDHVPRPGGRAGGAGRGEDAQGLPRLGQGQPGAGQLRLARRRLDAALAGRAARPARGRGAQARALPRHRAQHHRPGGRPDRRGHEPQRRLPAVHEGRPRARAGHLRRASARPTCPTCPPSPSWATRT